MYGSSVENGLISSTEVRGALLLDQVPNRRIDVVDWWYGKPTEGIEVQFKLNGRIKRCVSTGHGVGGSVNRQFKIQEGPLIF